MITAKLVNGSTALVARSCKKLIALGEEWRSW